MYKLIALIAITLLSGCATWVHESEVPEVLPAWKFAAGLTAAVNSTPVAPRQNFPATSVTRNTYDIYPSLKLGLGKSFELTGDLLPFQRESWSVDTRLRYQWLSSENGYVSAAAVGYFQGRGFDGVFFDAGSYFINNTFPYDWINRFDSKVRGVNFSNSFGKKLTDSVTAYAGPKIYLVNYEATYSHGVGGIEDKFTYSGPLYGLFTGLAWRYKFLILDSKLTLTRMPVNLRNGDLKWIPGFSLGVQFTNDRRQ